MITEIFCFQIYCALIAEKCISAFNDDDLFANLVQVCFNIAPFVVFQR